MIKLHEKWKSLEKLVTHKRHLMGGGGGADGEKW